MCLFSHTLAFAFSRAWFPSLASVSLSSSPAHFHIYFASCFQWTNYILWLSSLLSALAPKLNWGSLAFTFSLVLELALACLVLWISSFMLIPASIFFPLLCLCLFDLPFYASTLPFYPVIMIIFAAILSGPFQFLYLSLFLWDYSFLKCNQRLLSFLLPMVLIPFATLRCTHRSIKNVCCPCWCW